MYEKPSTFFIIDDIEHIQKFMNDNGEWDTPLCEFNDGYIAGISELIAASNPEYRTYLLNLDQLINNLLPTSEVVDKSNFIISLPTPAELSLDADYYLQITRGSGLQRQHRLGGMIDIENNPRQAIGRFKGRMPKLEFNGAGLTPEQQISDIEALISAAEPDTVVVVDDYIRTGSSISSLRQMLKSAHPEAKTKYITPLVGNKFLDLLSLDEECNYLHLVETGDKVMTVSDMVPTLGGRALYQGQSKLPIETSSGLSASVDAFLGEYPWQSGLGKQHLEDADFMNNAGEIGTDIATKFWGSLGIEWSYETSRRDVSKACVAFYGLARISLPQKNLSNLSSNPKNSSERKS